VDLEFRIPEGRTDCQFWEQSMVKRILAVDEDVDACENIRLVMKDTGVAVDIASDAADAGRRIREAAAKGECYDVILLDVDGTDMDVMEALAALREALPKRKADEPTPVLLLGEGLAEDVEPALETEGVGVLAKPFFVTALREKIAEAKAEFKKSNEAISNDSRFPMTPQRILKDVKEVIPEDAIIFTDVGWNKNGVAQEFDITIPGTIHHSSGLATIVTVSTGAVVPLVVRVSW